MATNIRQRLQAVRALMRASQVSCCFFPTSDGHDSEYIPEHDMTRRYLSGFTGSAGTLVVGLEEAGLFTDGRYFDQAEIQLRDTGIRLMRMREPGVPTAEEYALQLASTGVLGVEARMVSWEWARDMEKRLAPRRMQDIRDWWDELWPERPALPSDPVFLLPTVYAGESAAEKLDRIRHAMQADWHLITTLDDIAWVLNVRGNDVRNTPLVLSDLLIGRETAFWYVQEEKVPEPVRRELEAQGIEVRSDTTLEEDLRRLDRSGSILLDPARVNAEVARNVQGMTVQESVTPVMAMKAVKNETEVENLRRAHKMDGLALTRFMYWLKKEIGHTPMTERSAAEKLADFRQEHSSYLSPSFDTICAYREHAAMMHYQADETSDAVLEPRDLLLIDSGGQYLEGTTDVTRTFALGPVLPEQKRHFTAVVESVFQLSEVQFLQGMTGFGLDVLARAPIWKLGIDYRCGTGHGVGFLSCVHEGPNSFRWYHTERRFEDTVLVPGMITTDEPGVYCTGSHGIRTENELLCCEAGSGEYGTFLCFETITLCPIDLDALDLDALSSTTRQALNAYHARVYAELAQLLPEEEREWLRYVTRPV